MPTEPLIIGYYGKVHTHGDFVSRGLPAEFIEPWDTWLQEAIVNSREQLAGEWLECFLTSPVYRFALAPGICGGHGWLGIFFPSVDKVGRYYPMTIALRSPNHLNPFAALQHESSWLDTVEKLALTVLDNDFDLKQFTEKLFDLCPVSIEMPCPNVEKEQNSKQQQSQLAWQMAIEDKTIIEMLPCLLDNVLKEQYFSYSAWWTQGSERVSPSLLVCEGLPPFDGMAAMFDGDWERGGWAGHRYPDLPYQGE